MSVDKHFYTPLRDAVCHECGENKPEFIVETDTSDHERLDTRLLCAKCFEQFRANPLQSEDEFIEN